MRQTPFQQTLLVALILVCVATLAYYTTGVDWSYAYRSKSIFGATLVFCFAATLGLSGEFNSEVHHPTR
jgi:hypothetical protein